MKIQKERGWIYENMLKELEVNVISYVKEKLVVEIYANSGKVHGISRSREWVLYVSAWYQPKRTTYPIRARNPGEDPKSTE